MNLTGEQVQTLLRMLTQTKEDELDCNGCLQRLAEFAEQTLVGRPIPEGLRCLEEHLQSCGECREEFEALMAALDGEGAPL